MDNVNFTKKVGFQTDYVVFNCQRKPFDDPKVRQAIYHALDLQSIVKEIVKDGGIPAKPTMITPSMWIFEKDAFEKAFDALPDYEFSLDKAKALLAQTSVPNGFEATLITDNAPIRLSVATALQSAVEPLGIKLKVEQVTYAEMINRIQNTLDYDMSMDVWAADFPDPAGNLYPTHISTNIGHGGANQSAYVNKDVDTLLFEQNSTTDDVKRAELLIKAQALIANDAPEIVIDYPMLVQALNKNFTGYEVTPMWFWQQWTKEIYRTQ
jgi:peptide/nickel transport system substrate-binding protein